MKADLPFNEDLRLKELYDYQILDTAPQEDFDSIVRLASQICNTPISMISLIDAHRQWFKSKIGVTDTEHNRDISFCAHAIDQDDIFIIPDARVDDRFFDNPLVTGEPEIRFYAGVPLITDSGNRLGTLCVIDNIPRDITEKERETLVMLGKQVVKLMELHRSNQQLQAATIKEYEQRKKLEVVSEMQQKIISVIAHDVRSPLHSIKSLLQLIPEKHTIPSESAAYMDLAVNQLNSTLGLLDNLVEWGRLQMHGQDDAHKESDLYETVSSLLNELEITAELKKIRLKNNIPKKLLVATDENIINFILRNLIVNAIKFTNQGSVTIHATSAGETVLLKVQDTGIGMSPAILELLFCGQKRISRKGTHNEPGSGLGMSLVMGFIEKMKGHITAESEVGKGTTISFSLPAAGVPKETADPQKLSTIVEKTTLNFTDFSHEKRCKYDTFASPAKALCH